MNEFPEYKFHFQVIGSEDAKNDYKPLSWSYFVKKGNLVCKIWQFHKFSTEFIQKLSAGDGDESEESYVREWNDVLK